MKIVHLSTRDITGGASRAAYRLHTGLRLLGIDSRMLVARRSSNDSTVLLFKPPRDPISRLKRELRRHRIKSSLKPYRKSRPAGLELFSDDRTPSGINAYPQLPTCDVIHLHWIARFLDYTTDFAAILNKAPVVWTLHDMNPFTGGCHYDDGCNRWTESCGACPQLGSKDLEDPSKSSWKRKRQIFRFIKPGRLQIVAPSQWMAGEVRRSSLLGNFATTVIPYGVDIDIFAPRAQPVARAAFGIRTDAPIVLFVADATNRKRKGIEFLIQALISLSSMPEVCLLSVGVGAPKFDISISHVHLEFIANEQQLALAYSAADVLVLPSIQDNLPNTALESLACGTPIIGFAVGGLPEMVRQGANGLLVPLGDVVALGTAMKELLLNAERRREMSDYCRRLAVQEYSLEVQARRYLELYKQLPNANVH